MNPVAIGYKGSPPKIGGMVYKTHLQHLGAIRSPDFIMINSFDNEHKIGFLGIAGVPPRCRGMRRAAHAAYPYIWTLTREFPGTLK